MTTTGETGSAGPDAFLFDAPWGAASAPLPLVGRPGRDRLRGDGDDDVLAGGAGNDRLFGRGGNDDLDGGEGRDRLLGQAGHDSLSGGDGADRLAGHDGDDVLSGGAGRDRLVGGDGADVLSGGAGRDRLVGRDGADMLAGGADRDRLVGGDGADVLSGGAGRDRLVGGDGADTFRFGLDHGRDVIRDFAVGIDVIDLGAIADGPEDLAIRETRRGDAVVHTGEGRIVLRGVEADDLGADAFLFGEEGNGGTGDGAAKRVPEVTFEGSDRKVSIAGTATADQGLASNRGGDLVGLDELRSDPRLPGVDGDGYAVVVIDTGIDLDHPAFGPDANGDGVSDRIVHAQDFTNEWDGTADDENGHGTHVASIVGSAASACLGAAPAADIIALQALERNGSGTIAGIERALQWVVDNVAAYNIVAVNLSLGDSSNVNRERPDRSGLADEFAALASLDVVVAAAAGNDYFFHQREGVSSMAADPNALAVGAVWDGDHGGFSWGDGARDFTTGADRLTSFSQRSDDVGMVFAPGAPILGALPGGGSGGMSGTSQATPYVAGIAALAQDMADTHLGRRLTPAEFEDLLRSTADVIVDGDDEDDNVANTGASLPRVNAMALAEAIMAMADGGPAPDPAPEPTPEPSPQPTPEPEPPADDVPDDRSTGAVLSFDGPARGTIEVAGDRDWFAVTLEPGVRYAFTLSGQPSGAGTLPDPVLVLRDPSGAAVASNDDHGGTLESRIEFQVNAGGTYFLSAKAFQGATGSYVLAGEWLGRDDDLPAGPDTPSTLLPGGGDATGTLETAGDVDWHRLSVTAGTTYTIDLAGAGGPDGLADPLARLLTADGQLVTGDDDGGPGLDARIVHTATATGELFLAASAYGAGTGRYAVSVEASGGVTGDLPADASTPARLTPGGSLESTIDGPADRDWVAMTLEAGSSYTLALDGAGGAGRPLRDPVLSVFDPAGRAVAFNDDGPSGLDSLIEGFVPAESGVYYAEAAAFADSGAGGFRLTLSAGDGGPDEPVDPGEPVDPVDPVEPGGDVPDDASTTSRIDVGTPLTGELEERGDRDWHRLDLAPGTDYVVSLVGRHGGGGTLRDPFLRIHDTDGRGLGRDDDSGRGLSSELVLASGTGGEVFVSAGAFGDRGSGTYTVLVQELGGRARIVDDAPSDAGTEAVVDAGGRYRGSIERPGDRDWIAVELEAREAYALRVNGVGRDRLDDPGLVLRDAGGAVLASDDDGGRGLNAALTPFVAPDDGIYFIDVGTFDDEGTGDYVVRLRTLDVAHPGLRGAAVNDNSWNGAAGADGIATNEDAARQHPSDEPWDRSAWPWPSGHDLSEAPLA